MQLLGRKYRLIFGKPGAQGKTITGLDITFDVEKTTEAKPNTATVTVYNLSQESRAALEEPGTLITLEAGYEGQMGIIFVGNDLIVQTVKQGVDFVTTIKSKDGGEQVAETSVELDVAEGEEIEATVRKIVSKFDQITGRTSEFSQLPKKKSPRSYSLMKPAKEALTELLAPEEFQWSIQNGEFRVVHKDKASTETIFILGPRSGLIGSPEKTRFKLLGEEKDTEGISFTCLLNPEVTPLRRVQLNAASIKGMYKVTKVVYRGDYRGSDWYCVAEGVPL